MNVAVRGDAPSVEAVIHDTCAVVDPADADVVVAVDEAALADLAAEAGGPAAPVLAVLDGRGPPGVPPSRIREALEELHGVAGAIPTVASPVCAVAVEGEPVGTAVLDAALVPTRPAKISGYAIHAGDRRLDAFRADGVVVATPLGSGGYARAVGGPILGVDTGFVVCPISPYSTVSDTWVLDPPVAVTVERDDNEVSLLVDDAERRPVAPGERVRFDVERRLDLVRVPLDYAADR